jgi:hypothetical protein
MATSAAASLQLMKHQGNSSPSGGTLVGPSRSTQPQPQVPGHGIGDSDLTRAGAGMSRLTQNRAAAEPAAEEASGEAEQAGHAAGIGTGPVLPVQPPRRRVSFVNKLPPMARAPLRRPSGACGGEAQDGARATAEWVVAQAYVHSRHLLPLQHQVPMCKIYLRIYQCIIRFRSR